MLILVGGPACTPKGQVPSAAAQPDPSHSTPVAQKNEQDPHFADGLPEGPCQRAVSCEETKVLMNPDLTIDGRKVCFWDYDVRCACAKQLEIDDYQTCDESYY